MEADGFPTAIPPDLLDINHVITYHTLWVDIDPGRGGRSPMSRLERQRYADTWFVHWWIRESMPE